MCHDWILLPPGQSHADVCPYCGAGQTPPEAGDGTPGHNPRTISAGDDVSPSDAALLSLRVRQARIRKGVRSGQVGGDAATAEASSQIGTVQDKYPAPGGDFKVTPRDIMGDHVLMGNAAMIAADLGFAILTSSVIGRVFGLVVAIAATGTMVDTWVHKFFH